MPNSGWLRYKSFHIWYLKWLRRFDFCVCSCYCCAALYANCGNLTSTGFTQFRLEIAHCRNVRGLGKSMVVFGLFEKLRNYNERSTKFESLYHEKKYLEEENGKMVALQISPKIEFVWIWVDRRPQNYKGLYGILQLLQGSHLDNFPLKTLKLG